MNVHLLDHHAWPRLYIPSEGPCVLACLLKSARTHPMDGTALVRRAWPPQAL